ECAALQILNFQFPFARLHRETGNIEFQFGKTLRVRVPHDGHNESALRPDRYADIVEIVLDEIFAFNTPIDHGHGFERLDAGFDEERHQTQLDAISLRELLLRFRAQLLNRRHIALVKSREDGGSLLRHYQLRGNLATQRRHSLASE